jgi:hypothetical protein
MTGITINAPIKSAPTIFIESPIYGDGNQM